MDCSIQNEHARGQTERMVGLRLDVVHDRFDRQLHQGEPDMYRSMPTARPRLRPMAPAHLLPGLIVFSSLLSTLGQDATPEATDNDSAPAPASIGADIPLTYF